MLAHTLDDEIGSQDTHRRDTNTRLGCAVSCAKASEDDSAGTSHSAEEGLETVVSMYVVGLRTQYVMVLRANILLVGVIDRVVRRQSRDWRTDLRRRQGCAHHVSSNPHFIQATTMSQRYIERCSVETYPGSNHGARDHTRDLWPL